MPSSISGSKSKALKYALAVAAISAIIVAGLELFSIFLLRHHSLTYARISRQYEHAVELRPAAAGEPATVLMVGNSLLLHGVKLDQLEALTAARMRVTPIFLEATGYYDWYYALRRLFRLGARPQVVIVGVGVNYFLENGVRQDYAPMMFFDGGDALALGSDLGLDRTATSNLWLAHTSVFWDTRSVIRTQVLHRMIPHLEDLFQLVNSRPAVPSDHDFAQAALPRLNRLRDLCETNGAKLILLVPPTLSSQSEVSRMAYAAQTAGVEVSVPIAPAALTSKFYEPDGLHLNAEGALIFTAALASDLPAKIMTNGAIAARQ